MRKKIIIFVMLCMVTSAVLRILPSIFYLNVTSSLPIGLYIKIPGKECRRGDYIVFEPSEEVKEIIIKNGWGDGKHEFLKKVGAVAGDNYSIDEETLVFEAAGKYIGQAFETDAEGHKLPKLRGKFEVTEGYVLPIATSTRSFDGRYNGTISIERIKTRVVPILIL